MVKHPFGTNYFAVFPGNDIGSAQIVAHVEQLYFRKMRLQVVDSFSGVRKEEGRNPFLIQLQKILPVPGSHGFPCRRNIFHKAVDIGGVPDIVVAAGQAVLLFQHIIQNPFLKLRIEIFFPDQLSFDLHNRTVGADKTVWCKVFP